jgi:integrase
MFAEAEQRGRPIAPSTVARFLAVLRSALGTAVKTRRLAHNPAQHIELPEYRRPEIRPWSPAETGQFLDAVRGERLAALYELMLLEGLRRGEACGLRWADVDLAAGTVRVRHNRVEAAGRVVENAPKTRAGERHVELGTQSVQVLIAWQGRQAIEHVELGLAWTDTGHVFTREDGLPLRPENVSREFKRLTAAAGLRPIRLHDLRHLSASLSIAAGVRPEVVSKRLGHSATRITTDLYGHLLEGVGRAASDAGAALIPRETVTQQPEPQ